MSLSVNGSYRCGAPCSSMLWMINVMDPVKCLNDGFTEHFPFGMISISCMSPVDAVNLWILLCIGWNNMHSHKLWPVGHERKSDYIELCMWVRGSVGTLVSHHSHVTNIFNHSLNNETRAINLELISIWKLTKTICYQSSYTKQLNRCRCQTWRKLIGYLSKIDVGIVPAKTDRTRPKRRERVREKKNAPFQPQQA